MVVHIYAAVYSTTNGHVYKAMFEKNKLFYVILFYFLLNRTKWIKDVPTCI